MKKFLSLLVATLIAFTNVSPVFAENQIVIPAASESTLTNIQLESIEDFLGDYKIVQRCLRNKNDQENEKMTLGIAVCSIIQVFDPKNANFNTAWSTAKKLGLIDNKSKQSDPISGIRFLTITFKAAGISISPLSEDNYKKMLTDFRLRLTTDQLRAIATALEQGLVPEPKTQKEAQMLRKTLTKNNLTVADALGLLYQISLSRHGDLPVISIDRSDSGQTVPLETILKEIINIIKEQSYFNDSFDEKVAMEEAIRAMVKSLKADKYIEYYTEEEYNSFSGSLNGDLEGIGAYIEQKEGFIVIVSPIEGGPADKAGVRAGDVITKIDNVSVEGLTVEQAIGKIRGPQGTKVTLTIKREQQTLDITITREKLTIPAVVSSNKDGIEVIKIAQFGATVSSELLAELKTLPQKNPKGIIIDLRNDPGGFLDEVVKIVNFFLVKDKPVVFLSDHFSQSPINTTEDPIITNIPISVLINKGSASASEILAGALQSYGLAKIYGETSYGKGTVQNIFTLLDPETNELSAFKFTTAEYLIGNPDGKPISINGIGVKPNDNPGGPDQPLLDDEKTTNDEALDAVIGIMNKMRR